MPGGHRTLNLPRRDCQAFFGRRRLGGAVCLILLFSAGVGGPLSGGEGTGATSIPFEMVKHQILLPVRLGEGAGPYFFLLDTGVNPSGIDLALARELGLVEGDQPVGEAGGVGNDKVFIYAATIKSARLGGLPLEAIPAVAMDFTGLGKRLGRPLHGILGYSFLKGRIVRIDYPQRQVVLLPAGFHYQGKPAFREPLVFVANDTMPLLESVAVNGKLLPLSLDTGSSLVLELYPEGAAQAGVTAAPEDQTEITGARGDEKAGLGQVQQIALGELSQADCEVLLPPHQRPGNRLGNLGNGFLKHYVLTLDYVNAELIIEEPPADRAD